MTLIRLAANPFSQEADTAMTTAVHKGRQVSGPRTKLAAQQPLTKADGVSLVRLMMDTQRATLSLAKSVQILAKGRVSNQEMYQDDDMMAQPPVEDDMGMGMGGGGGAPGGGDAMDGQPQFPEEQPQDLMSMAEDFDSDFVPYGSETDAGGEYREGEDTDQETPAEAIGGNESELTKAYRAGQRSVLSRARVRKDDGASSFGEKDEDIKGNRQNVPDDKGKPAEEYLIQGDTGDGPGMVSNAYIRKALQNELSRMGIVRKAAPGGGHVPASTVNKAENDEYALFEQMKGRSFADIAKCRTEVGDLPAGPL
jgi:hypothetical protein